MCFGGGGGNSQPKQKPVTQFDYSADRSNTAQQRAALLASTNGGAADTASFGSSLGTGGSDGGLPAAGGMADGRSSSAR